jgi:Zn-dependent protease
VDLSPEVLLRFTIGYVVLLFSLVIHENAHAVSAEHYGDPTARDAGRITLNPLPHMDPIGTVLIPLLMFLSPYRLPLIGWARPVPVNPAYFRNPIVHDSHVAAAGPISNFILAVAGTILYIIVLLVYKHVPALQDGGGNSFLFFQIFFQSLIQINCVLGIFNLLPIPPLDGHWVLFRYLPSRWAGMLVAIRPYGFFILIALMWTGVLGLILAFPMHVIAGALFSVVEFAWSVL